MSNHTYNHSWEKLEQIEKEIIKLKKAEGKGFSKSPISLKGILKGIKISAFDTVKAKQGLFTKKFL